MAKAYGTGAGGKQDPVKALVWALLAQTSGDKRAAPLVQEYQSRLTAQQIKSAEHQAEKFKPHA